MFSMAMLGTRFGSLYGQHQNAVTTAATGRRGRARYQQLSQVAEKHLRAELEYWRELEFLSGQREDFKPGRTDETAHADDEVEA